MITTEECYEALTMMENAFNEMSNIATQALDGEADPNNAPVDINSFTEDFEKGIKKIRVYFRRPARGGGWVEGP
jgi:hypothetical protein